RATKYSAGPGLPAAGPALGRDRRDALAAVERLAAVEGPAVDGGDGGDAQGCSPGRAVLGGSRAGHGPPRPKSPGTRRPAPRPGQNSSTAR
ncbi:hypothetical protein ACI2L5_52620, partial [Streptomyces milbemycinicus]